MFKVAEQEILLLPIEVLKILKQTLAENGIERFERFIETDRNIQFNCPNHSSGKERKPSCGITTKETLQHKAGVVHCFTCGYTVSLEEMISYLFGYNDGGVFGTKWLLKNFIVSTAGNRRSINLNLDRNIAQEQIEFISEEELESYRFYHPYMFQRKLTEEVIDKFDVGYDKQTNCITFPVRDKKGNCVFVGRRGINYKYFNYPKEANKPLYGLFELSEDAEEVIICESFFNALTCYVYGKPALALMGLGTKYQYEQLKQLKVRKLILAFDGDKAGDNAMARMMKNLKDYKIMSYYYLPTGKDINDLNEKEFQNLEEFF